MGAAPRRGPFNLGPARRPPARVSGDFSMILQRLREETRAAHDAIERDLEAFGAQRSLDRHRLLMARFFGFYAAWEPQVASSLADEPFFSPRRKLPLLEQDLEFLGYDRAMIEAAKVQQSAGADEFIGNPRIALRARRLDPRRPGHRPPPRTFARSIG